MTVDQYEQQIKKPWKQWDRLDQRAFVRVLDGTEPVYPLLLELACLHAEVMPDAFARAVLVPAVGEAAVAVLRIKSRRDREAREFAEIKAEFEKMSGSSGTGGTDGR